MEAILQRLVDDLLGRLHGPLTFRLVLQPIMALLLGVKDGVHDARDQKPAYLWAMFTAPSHRLQHIREGWTSIGKLFGAAFVLDCFYQLVAFKWIYPAEALVVSLLLAVVPYTLIRGTVNRLMGRRLADREAH
jgi:hypothetical protein